MNAQLDLLIESPVSYARTHAHEFRAGFADWLETNAHIYAHAEADLEQLWARGWRHYSMRTIVEHIRHETNLREEGGDFKCNNNHAPDMARLYMATHDRPRFLETRNGRVREL